MWNNSYESRLAWTDKTYLRDRNNGTCSGASGTAIATGKKTYYYSLGVDYDRNAMYSIARHAKENMQKAIGVATNCRVSDATPAVFFANNASRNNGEEIFRQLIIESKADVIIGSGNPEYDSEGLVRSTGKYQYTGDEEMWEDLKANNTTFRSPSNSGWTEIQDIDGDDTPDPWTLVEDSASFAALMTGNTPKRILGLAKVSSGLQFYRTGENSQEVHFDDWIPNMPELWQLSRVALNGLSKNANGFFLMIEGDMGDNAGHQNLKGRLIEEQMAFNKSVDSVITWIEANGGWEENLLIVTADHETGLLADPDYNTDSIFLNHHELGDNGVGQIPAMTFYAGHHSNQLIPLFAKGAGSEVFYSYADEQDFVRGKFLNNSEIGQSMFELWDGNACKIINNRPIVVSEIPTIKLTVGVDTTFSIPLSYFFDEEETELKFTVGAKPSYLTVTDASTLTFSGTPTSAGSKNTKITITDGKTSGAAISIETYVLISASVATSINEPSQTNITAYPNPATTQLVIKVPSGEGNISLIDAQGKTVKNITISSNEEIISLQGLSSGSYTIIITEKSGSTQQKIIIK